jgi:carbon monoxide dehydrogenase subunit G
MHFEGEKDYPLPPDDVFGKLTDARFLLGCVPGVEAVARQDVDEAVWTLRPGLSFVRGTLETTLRVADRQPPASARFTVLSKGIGSSAEVAGALTVEPRNGGTHVRWSADVTSLGGLLKAVPQGLIKASAQKVLADLWAAIDAKIEAK